MELDVLDGLGRLGLSGHWYRSDMRQLVHSLAEKRGGLADPPPRAMRERACEIYESLVVQLQERDTVSVRMIGPPPTRKQVRSMKRTAVNDAWRPSGSLTEPEVERLERTRREVLVHSGSGVSASWTNRKIGPAIELQLSHSPSVTAYQAYWIPDAFLAPEPAIAAAEALRTRLDALLDGRRALSTFVCAWKE